MFKLIKGFLRAVCIFIGIWVIIFGLISVGIGVPGGKTTILNRILGTIFVLSLAIVFFLIASWLKKGSSFNVKKDTVSILLSGVKIYLGVIIGTFVVLLIAKLFKINWFNY